MSAVQEITSLKQFQELLNSGKLFFVDFWATWCGPCRFISPIFEELAKKTKGDAEFYKVDVDAVSDVSEECSIRAMPTFIAFKDGNKIGEFVGADVRRLTSFVNSNLQSGGDASVTRLASV